MEFTGKPFVQRIPETLGIPSSTSVRDESEFPSIIPQKISKLNQFLISPLPHQIEFHEVLEIGITDFAFRALDNDSWTLRAQSELTATLDSIDTFITDSTDATFRQKLKEAEIEVICAPPKR